MIDWHESYRQRYKKLKEKGVPFFPDVLFKDAVVAVLVVAVLCWLSVHFGAGLEDLADPADANYNPRPEWYFLFLFQALKVFPGRLEAVAAVVVPGLGMAALALLPFLDRSPLRHPLDRPFAAGAGLLALSVIAYLTWAGATSPLTNPVVEKDPLAAQGQRLYAELRCSYCHSIKGRGGRVGPDLDEVVGEETDDWLAKHFRDPQSVTPGSAMPRMHLLDDEVAALVAYMRSIAGGDPFTPEAPKLFADNCAACHRIGKTGGEAGPDLSLIGTAREKPFIKRYLEDPSKLNPSSAMPGFKGQLAEVQIEDLARYLASQGRSPRKR